MPSLLTLKDNRKDHFKTATQMLSKNKILILYRNKCNNPIQQKHNHSIQFMSKI